MALPIVRTWHAPLLRPRRTFALSDQRRAYPFLMLAPVVILNTPIVVTAALQEVSPSATLQEASPSAVLQEVSPSAALQQ